MSKYEAHGWTDLGFKTFEDYLKSDLWKVLRRKMMSYDPDCRICGNESSQVVFLSFTKWTLLGRKPELLACVCDDCWVDLLVDERGGPRYKRKRARRCMELISGQTFVRGKSNRMIGRWFEEAADDYEEFRDELAVLLQPLIEKISVLP